MTKIADHKTPRQIREEARSGKLRGVTAGLALGYTQANLVILPRDYAFDFLLFCQRNPRPCPLLEVLEPGQHEAASIAQGSDIRTDLPAYRVYREGVLEGETSEITELWRDDLVSFLLGCSFTFEEALLRAGIPLRHIEMGQNVAMYLTNMETRPAGDFSGPMVVSMRPIRKAKVIKAVQVTSRYPAVHGAPIHIGDPKAIGIQDLSRPDYGDPVEIKEDEVPVFWACGVTPQAVAVKSKPSLMITHAPGHMFVTDLLNEDIAAL
ncbi:MAG: putative hydro-lyase [Dehalococcoidia bacterium]